MARRQIPPAASVEEAKEINRRQTAHRLANGEPLSRQSERKLARRAKRRGKGLTKSGAKRRGGR